MQGDLYLGEFWKIMDVKCKSNILLFFYYRLVKKTCNEDLQYKP